MKSILSFLLAILFLAGCDGARQFGPESPYFRFPPGSVLILNQPLEIPPDSATARLQFGRLVAFGHVQEQEPHCLFEIDTVRPTPQRIEADRFAIVRAYRDIGELPFTEGFFIRAAFADDEPVQLFYKTVFLLRSERQPQVRRLMCQHDQKAGGIGLPRHLTVSEIRSALGPWFTLQLP